MEESGQLKVVEEEGELFPNFNIKFFNGHTDGQMIPHIKYKDRTVVYMADLLPSTAHIPIPWVMAYDTRPLLTLDEKKSFYKDALENDYVLFFEHDIYNECCTLEATERGPKVKETFLISDL